ncbi:hypothetical protein DIPPA_18073 [Diplonema papillatum]|nr:hypothetical protein DIPPA_18073 [Diplonema papillatum]
MNDEKTGESDTMLALAAGRYPNWVDENTLIEVIDPAIKQKLTVPLVNLEHTNGLGTYFLNKDDPKRRESYLCMLYQKNKCKSHLRCNQIHADRDFVQRVK